MHRGLRSAFLALSTGLLVTVGGVTATTITAGSYQTWKTSLTGAPVDLDFSGVQFNSYNTAAGFILAPAGDPANAFTFTGPDNAAFQLSGITYSGFPALAGATDAGAGISIANPAAGKNAIFLSVASSASTPLTLTLSDGEMFTLGNGFFGFATSHPITSLDLTTTAGSQPLIDWLSFGTSSLTQDPAQGQGADPGDAPEGATLVMMAGGSLILMGARRKIGVASPTSL